MSLQHLSPILFKTGETYIGKLRNDKPYGYGIINYKNGFSFEGEFRYGDASVGVVRDDDGELLNGYHVQEYYTASSAEREVYITYQVPFKPTLYRGDYLNGKRHGFGVLTGTTVHKEGDYKDDLMDGEIYLVLTRQVWTYSAGVYTFRMSQRPSDLKAAAKRLEAAEKRWASEVLAKEVVKLVVERKDSRETTDQMLLLRGRWLEKKLTVQRLSDTIISLVRQVGEVDW